MQCSQERAYHLTDSSFLPTNGAFIYAEQGSLRGLGETEIIANM